ncbi:MAG: hypothetical protein WA709_08320 [Stellaceae bacterium]
MELATIAETFSGTGDHASATQYWEAAIHRVQNKNLEVQYRRNYATYLFGTGNIGAGRQEFQRAIDLFPESDDISQAQNGATYKFWGLNELRAKNKRCQTTISLTPRIAIRAFRETTSRRRC